MESVKLPKWEGSPLLPSAFQLGDFVHLAIGEASFRFAHGNVLKHGKVIKIHFTPGKVCYDLEFTVSIDNANKKRYTTRIHNVDGALCEAVESEESPIMTPDHNSFYDNILWSLEKSSEEIGSLNFQRSSFSASEWNHILHNLHKDLGDSPFNHGGWHGAKEIPVSEKSISRDKLIDIDGNRKTFRVGWYDSNLKIWFYYHEENDQPIDQKNMKWTDLPLA